MAAYENIPSAPLKGIKVIEFAGLAPGPYAGLILADWGASVIRVDRADQPTSTDFLCRGKRSIAINSKVTEGREVLRKLISEADVVIDPFRPGVMERLGLGPGVFLGEGGLNKSLVYARMAGFPRSGPNKDMAGHDINYLALSGVLSMLSGSDSKPKFPLNLLADFAGGGLMCALGIILALFQRVTTKEGQVVDADMVSGTRYLASFPLIHSLIPDSPLFGSGEAKGTGRLDGGAPFYNVYECKDGRWISVGCLEPQFYKVFIETFIKSLPIEFVNSNNGWVPSAVEQNETGLWQRLRSFLVGGFKTKTRDEWSRLYDGKDACVLPVLSPEEAACMAESAIPLPHPRLTPYQSNSGRTQSDTPKSIHEELREVPYLEPGQHTAKIINELGFSDEDIDALRRSGALGPKYKL